MEYDFQTILSSSDKCGVGICENSIEHYCQTHRKLICKSCLLRFHTDCKSVDQINIKTMILAINKQKFKLNEIIEYDTNFNFSSRFDNLNGELTFYKVEIDEIEGKINTIASNFNASKLAQIHENIMRLYKLFLNSDLYVKYLKDKEATKDLNIEFNRSQSKATDEVKQLEEEKTTPTETNLKRENKILKEEIAKLKSQINSSNSKNESGAQEIKEEQLKSNKNSFPFYLMLGYYSKSFVFNEEGILTIDMKKVRQYDLIKYFIFELNMLI